MPLADLDRGIASGRAVALQGADMKWIRNDVAVSRLQCQPRQFVRDRTAVSAPA